MILRGNKAKREYLLRKAEEQRSAAHEKQPEDPLVETLTVPRQGRQEGQGQGQSPELRPMIGFVQAKGSTHGSRGN